jgi:hypothetical protein
MDVLDFLQIKLQMFTKWPFSQYLCLVMRLPYEEIVINTLLGLILLLLTNRNLPAQLDFIWYQLIVW